MYKVKVKRIHRGRSGKPQASLSDSKSRSSARIHIKVHPMTPSYTYNGQRCKPRGCFSSTYSVKAFTTTQVKNVQKKRDPFDTSGNETDQRILVEQQITEKSFDYLSTSVHSRPTLHTGLAKKQIDEASDQRVTIASLTDIIEKQHKVNKRKSQHARFCPYSSLCICLGTLIALLALISLAALLTGLLFGLQRSTTTITTTLMATTTIKPPLTNVNLIINGDGETGPCGDDSNITSPTGWNYTGPITQVYYNSTIVAGQRLTTPGPSDRGQCYFYGQISASTSMWQTINLSHYADPIYIDTYRLRFNLSAWIGGLGTQDDHAVVSVTFTDPMNLPIGNQTTIGPVLMATQSLPTSLLFRQTTDYVPIGARLLTVLVTITRVSGTISNGNVDNIAVYLYQ